MIIVSEPSAKVTRLTNTGRYKATHSCSSAANNDTPKHANVQQISVHTNLLDPRQEIVVCSRDLLGGGRGCSVHTCRPEWG
jgi:hypothetical protein